MRYPEKYGWEYPGWYSISVSYFKTNDFFYSGHVGFSLIGILEFFRKKCYYFAFLFAFPIMIIEIFVIIGVRGHYSIDILAGILMALYFEYYGELLSNLLSETMKKISKNLKKKRIRDIYS